jgi:hypothetical protein
MCYKKQYANGLSDNDPRFSVRYRKKVINLECGYRDRNWVGVVVGNGICSGPKKL